MKISEAINGLGLQNRAYQVLYALGDSSSTVRTLTPGEAQALVNIVDDVYGGFCATDLDVRIRARMSPAGMRYVAHGTF